MSVMELQRVLNSWGVTDNKGNILDSDGIRGKCTNQAIFKARKMLILIRG